MSGQVDLVHSDGLTGWARAVAASKAVSPSIPDKSVLLRLADGVIYLPLRAVPIVTTGVLHARIIALMLCNPDDYCDSEHGDSLTAFAYQRGRAPHMVHHRAFAKYCAAPMDDQPFESGMRFPGGHLLRELDARSLYELFVEHRLYDTDRRIAAWNTEPVLTAIQRKYIFEGLDVPRKNAAVYKQVQIQMAVRRVEEALSQRGVTVDFGQLPGTKDDWIVQLQQIDPGLRFAPATFDHHFKALEMKWQPGTRRGQLQDLLALPTRIEDQRGKGG